MKNNKLNDRRITLHRQVIILSTCTLCFVLGGLANEFKHYLQRPQWEDKQLRLYSTELLSPVTNYELNKPVYAQEATKSTQKAVTTIIEGKASYYTVDGCIGCNDNRKMANGEILDDNKKTIALTPELYRQYKNQEVYVMDIANELVTKCKVTDTGGFYRYGRIADLSKACAEAVNLKTDKTVISIVK